MARKRGHKTATQSERATVDSHGHPGCAFSNGQMVRIVDSNHVRMMGNAAHRRFASPEGTKRTQNGTPTGPPIGGEEGLKAMGQRGGASARDGEWR
jgi:hypothetical protein